MEVTPAVPGSRKRSRRSVEGHARLRSGAHLRAARERRGLSLRDVAFLARKPTAYTFIGRLERGEQRRCSMDFAAKIAAAVGKDFEDLFEAVVPATPHQAALARRRAAARAA